MNEVQNLQSNTHSNAASFFERLVAILFDSSLSYVVFSAFIFLGLAVFFPDLRMYPTYSFDLTNILTLAAILLTSLVLTTAFNLVHYLLLVPSLGGSIGKLITGLKLLNSSDGTHLNLSSSFWRHFAGYQVSGVFFYIGYLSMLKDAQGYTWHDHMFGTKVISTGNRLILGIIGNFVLAGIFAYILYTIITVFVPAFIF